MVYMLSLILKLLKPNILFQSTWRILTMAERQILVHSRKRGEIFSEFCTNSFTAKILSSVNEVLFEMVKTSLNDTYLGGTITTVPQNDIYTCQQMYYNKETRVIVNQSVNQFYTWFLLKNNPLPEDVVFPLDISGTFFNNLNPDVREFLISEGVQVTPRPPTETNQHGNQRLFGQKCGCGSRRYNKIDSATIMYNMPSQDICGNALGKPLNTNGLIGHYLSI